MLDFLLVMTSKQVVVAFALVGALLSTFPKSLGNLVVSCFGNKRLHNRELAIRQTTKLFVTVGYSTMFLSILLFIVSGFIIDLS
ncbi:MAG: hypothetical protein EBT20_18760 [Alphaproteobacteria bacterium]|nr:hypothetical protein [Alphaproteobacteria bacterium]